MKKISFTLLLLTLATTISHAQTHTGDLTLSSQTAIDTFNFAEVTGNLTINDTDDGNITNLSGLRGLTQVGGFLSIGGNTSLTSLNGLEDLTLIEGILYIGFNASLPSLSGLDALATIGGNIDIPSNTSLSSLNGLEMLNSIGGVLSIRENPALLDFCAISSLIGDANQITAGEYTVHTNSYNPSYASIQTSTACSITETILTSQAAINGFSTTEVGDLVIEEATPGEITNLNALSTLTTIGNTLRIRNNTALTSLSGLEMLDSIGDRLIITGNTALTDFCAISSLVGDANQITAGEYFVNTNSYNPPYTFIQNESLCSPSAGIFVGDLTLDTQDSIDAFRYRGITGNLTINDAVDGNITNLNGLSGLTDIGGFLSIQSNDSLPSLSGLDALATIGGNIDIPSNTSLSSLNGLEMLNSIGGVLSIRENPALLDFCAISSLIGDANQITAGEYTVHTNSYNPSYASIQTSTACSITETILTSQAAINGFSTTEVGDLVIEEATPGEITNLNALSTLTTIGNTLRIRNNTALTSLSGLEMLDSIGDRLIITGNTALTDFCAISSLVGDANQITAGEYFVNTNSYNPPYTFIQNESLCSPSAGIFVGDLTLDTQDSIDAFRYRGITGNLTINDAVDGNITNLNGLSGLTDIGGFLSIQSNDSLPSLSGLDSLTEIGGYLYIFSNAFTSLSGLESLTDIGGNLNIELTTLMSLSGLESLTEIGGDLDIRSNNSLSSLSGLESLTDIGGFLNIASNGSLISLSGLSSLTEIGGNLTIQLNPLASLSGLEMLESIGGVLSIRANTLLSNFCAISSLIGDDKQITMGEYTVSENSINPTYSRLQEVTYCDGSTFFGNLTLDTQDSIDVFHYRGIAGNLTIQGSSITNLDSLSSLTEIGGFLQILSNATLTSLSGLASLTEIGRYLWISSNDSLTSLSGLDSLTEMGEYLNISSNPSLMSLSGLELLASIGGTLTITGNPALTDFCAISSLIGDDKQITMAEYDVATNGYNPSYNLIDDENYCSNADGGIFVGDLTLNHQDSIDSFSYRRIIGDLTIDDAANGNITNLDGLSGLIEIQGFLNIQNNASLTSFRGLSSLTEIGGLLQIQSNATLTSLSGLESLTDIGGFLWIQSNATLTSLSGLESLTEIGGYLNVNSNNSLLSLSGLESLTEIGGFSQIQSNPSLTSLSGLDSLTEIGRYLTIQNNATLTSLSGLSSLTEIGGFLQIANNDTLTSLSGLEMLDSIGGTLIITGNRDLTDFCVLSSLIGDDKQITSGEYTVNMNGYNPPYTFIQNESLCSPSAGIFDGNLTVNTQDSIDDFRYRAITGNLIIDDSVANAITNLDGLSELTNIGGELRIQTNDSLVSLSGLELLASIGDTLAITGNPALTDFCSLSSLIGDDNQITMGKYTVNTNGYNPPYTIVGNETFCSNADGGIFVGDLTLANQAAIDTFNYRGITGFLTISGSSITNLDSLESLTDIGGYLQINGNASLPSLSGLESLTDIGGYLYIGFNDSLTSLSGLESLTEIGGFLNISSNLSLTSLSGLSSLTDIGRNLEIFSNRSLPSLSGLEMLDSIGGNLTLTSNTALTDFCAISSLIGDDNQITSGEYTVNTNSYNPPYTFVETENLCSNLDGGIFDGNLRLTSQDSINAFRYRGITGNLIINDSINGNIKNLSGLSELIQVGGILQIDSNSFLTSLSGLESLIEIGRYLTINDNDSLGSLSGLESLHSTGDTLIVTGNRDLADFCTISSLIGDDKQITSGDYTVNTNSYNPPYTLISNETFCSNADGGIFVGELTVNNQAAIDTFNYRGITGNLTINDSINANITNLDGLASLTEIRGNLSIQSNESLTSLSGLEMLDSIGGALTITGNTALTNFCVISSLIGDDKQITSGDYTVNTNGYNPPYTEIQTTTRCSLDPPVVVADLPDVSIQPGDAFDPINLASAFSDPNRYALTYTATSSDETAVTVSIINDSTLTLVEVNGEGTATITVTATNDSVLSVSTTFTVSIILNLPPTVANSLMDVEIVSGTAFAPIDFSAVFSDPEGDVLTYTVASSDVAIVTATLNGTALTLTETGKGTATITVTASDAFRSVEATFEVTITNTAPVVVANQLVTVSTQPGTPFAPIDLSTAFTDANGDELTYTAASSDETVVTVSVSGTTLTLTEVGGVGTATITVTASDGEASINGTFMAIISDNNAPIRTPLAFPEIPAVMVGFQLTPPVDLTPFFSDPDGDALTYTATTGDASIATVEIVQTSRMTFTAIGVGTTMLTVTATDPEGFSVTESVTIIVEEGALGIAETDILVVYPNPSSGVFELSRRATTVRVYDMNGRLVYRGRNIKQLDLTTHPSGQYLVEVGVGKEKGRYTVIRE